LLLTLVQVDNQAFFSKRVIPTKITAPTKATIIAPIMPAPGQIIEAVKLLKKRGGGRQNDS